jgi:hypothetical protein
MTGLVQQRCRLHPVREAVARCPECGGYFCRECVTEHGGRVLCAACLARLAAAGEARPARERLAGTGRLLAAACGVVALWLLFFLTGRWLITLPSDVHDGTVWTETVRNVMGSSPGGTP